MSPSRMVLPSAVRIPHTTRKHWAASARKGHPFGQQQAGHHATAEGERTSGVTSPAHELHSSAVSSSEELGPEFLASSASVLINQRLLKTHKGSKSRHPPARLSFAPSNGTQGRTQPVCSSSLCLMPAESTSPLPAGSRGG